MKFIPRWFRRLRNNFTQSYRVFTIGSVILLYLIAAACFVANLLYSAEWTGSHISKGFLISVVLIPIVSTSLAFGLQVISLITESRLREERERFSSRFLVAIERSQIRSVIGKSFLVYLLEEWGSAMQRLGDGVITIQKDYWRVCSQLYELTHDEVDCTSMVPMGFWDNILSSSERPEDSADPNLELIQYKESQRQILIEGRKISVKRTFILKREELKSEKQIRQFLEIVCRQLSEGFQIYYIWLDDYLEDQKIYSALAQDFSLIDNRILMLGTMWGMSKTAYLYTFYDLSSIRRNPMLFEPSLQLMANRNKVISGELPELVIQNIRKRIDAIECLQQDTHNVYKTAIDSLIKSKKY